jgi:3-deoxy-manno-octulosonate cytidylyltransferase (CMP-KDO synthetase)
MKESKLETTMEFNNSVSVIIPARYKSSRFPGKPLVDILGKPMIVRVADLSSKAVGIDNVYVATDDKRIGEVVEKYGYKVVYTSEDCLTGTDRVAEAALTIDSDIIINVQGDEALLEPSDIIKVVNCKIENKNKVVNCMAKLTPSEDPNDLRTCKVVTNLNKELLYVSRAAIPSSKKGMTRSVYKQVCIYAFNREELKKYFNLGKQNGKTPAEQSEDIEIIRCLEIGMPVKMVEVDGGTMAVDFPEDVREVENIFRKKQLYSKLEKKIKTGIR